MQIDIRFRSLEPSEVLRDHAERRLHLSLGRFGPELTAITLRVGDLNGPKGGLDKRCQVTARGRRIGAVTAEDVSSDAYAAVDLAIERLARALAHAVERARAARPVTIRRSAS